MTVRSALKDYGCYTQTLVELHVVVFACLMLKKSVAVAAGSLQPPILRDSKRKSTAEIILFK
jgi:hypothetical protein